MSSWGATPLGASAGRASAAQAEPAAPVRGRIASGKSLVLPAPARLLPLLPTVDSMKPGLGIRDSGFVEAVLPAFTNPESLLPNHGLFKHVQRPGIREGVVYGKRVLVSVATGGRLPYKK